MVEFIQDEIYDNLQDYITINMKAPNKPSKPTLSKV
jgi:hypothetical protein